MTADFEFSGTDLNVIVTMTDPRQIIVRAQLVEQTPEGPQRTDKYIHLATTTVEAMRLMALLQAAQSEHSLWSETRRPIATEVPPAKNES